jgi:hypothetical protein
LRSVTASIAKQSPALPASRIASVGLRLPSQ